MSKDRTTKKSLITSSLAMLTCLTMLIGTTFAWFTDTAQTNVNKVQSGTLKVDIQNKENKSLDGRTLEWKTIDGKAQEDILWEPGATYELTPFKIVNRGKLAIKYKIEISGIENTNTAEKDLRDVLEFTYKIGDSGAVYDMDTEHQLAKNEASEYITISAQMDKNANNDYQDLTVEGVSITVYATQATVEYDSYDNTYDRDASYAEEIATGKTISSGTVTINKGVVAKDANAIALKVTGSETNVTIENGFFDGGSGGNNQCIHVKNGATVTIKNGTFTVGADAKGIGNSVIESYDGNIIIEGGFFKTDYQYRGKYYVLNQNNSHSGTITVKGGTFVNQDPSQGDDNLGGNFVAPGYKVVSEKQANGDIWYTVVPE